MVQGRAFFEWTQKVFGVSYTEGFFSSVSKFFSSRVPLKNLPPLPPSSLALPFLFGRSLGPCHLFTPNPEFTLSLREPKPVKERSRITISSCVVQVVSGSTAQMHMGAKIVKPLVPNIANNAKREVHVAHFLDHQIYGSAAGSTALLRPFAMCEVHRSWTAHRCTAVFCEMPLLQACTLRLLAT